MAHAVVALSAGGPVAVPDVPAYLTYSQWLHGAVLPDVVPYFPGYGLLLMPFGWMSGDSLHTAALLINGVLASLTIPLARKAVSQLSCPKWVEFVAPALAMVLPVASVASRIAWPEMLIGVTVLSLFVLLMDERWVLAGLIAGLLLAVHPRMVVVIMGCLVAAACHRSLKPVLLGLIPGISVTALILMATNAWPESRLQAAQTVGDGINPIVTTSGQWLALAAGTGGLAVYGLVFIVASLRRESLPAAHVFLATSAIGMLLLGGWVLAGSSRTDTILYGRYLDPWGLALTIVALAALSTGCTRRQIGLTTAGVTLIAGFICVAASSDGVEPARTIMTLSLGSLWSLCGGRVTLVVLAATAIALVGLLLTFEKLYLTIALALLLAVTGTFVDHRRLHSVGQVAEGQATMAHMVPGDVQCLAHDQSTKSYALWLYRLQLPDIHHRRLDLTIGQQPCGRYVVAEVTALVDCGGAELVGTEPRANWGLWKYPSHGCP